MPIEIQDDHVAAERIPVVKRTHIGECALIAIIDDPKQRDVLKRNEITKEMEPVINPRTGKPKKELVIYGITLPGHTAPVGLGEEQWVPEPGTVVRMILRGLAFSAWIDGRKTHRNGNVPHIGDVIRQVVDVAQSYAADGSPTGDKITDQTAVDALRARGKTVGLYGPLTIHEPKDPAWVDKAEAAYWGRRDANRQPIPVSDAYSGPDPF